MFKTKNTSNNNTEEITSKNTLNNSSNHISGNENVNNMIPINLTDTIIKENFEINDIPIETSSVIYNSEINNINTNIEDT
ncbi:hypothetical protein H8356DRAFT_1422252 [Neocallimastix lanati (nom. inval.)]|nr:hypothetical protein H8356DRAFT_1422252 [Neocallimastix sp. JGI-2020a]